MARTNTASKRFTRRTRENRGGNQTAKIQVLCVNCISRGILLIISRSSELDAKLLENYAENKRKLQEKLEEAGKIRAFNEKLAKVLQKTR